MGELVSKSDLFKGELMFKDIPVFKDELEFKTVYQRSKMSHCLRVF